jgi:hypothetical protein
MNGSLQESWDYLAEEIWQPLAEFSSSEDTSPPGLFSDLFAAADEFLSPRPAESELEEAHNDPVRAKERFFALKGTDFTAEFAIVLFLEEAHRVVLDYDILGYENYYRGLLSDALRKFNLRYRLDEPFALRFMLPGSFNNLYGELQRLNIGSAYLCGLLIDFEKAFDRYVRTEDETDLKTCIGNASKYVEGLAVVTCGKSGSLGDLCKEIDEWPHGAVQAALRNLYGFCSDYPGIRHAGNPQGQKRLLDKRDSVAINVALLALAAYLGGGMDQESMLCPACSAIEF